jgi:hypothetical protein
LLGAAKPHQLADNLGAADLVLGEGEIAALDAATELGPVYPNWFIDRLGDQRLAEALSR